DTQNMLEKMKVIVIQAPMNDDNIFRTIGVKKAASISLFHEKDQQSLYVLMNLEKFSQREKTKLRFKKLLIHIEDNRYRRELLSFLRKIDHFSFQVEVLNVYEEMAKRFWKYHQSIFETKKDVHLLVVGYDMRSEEHTSELQSRFDLV